MLSCILDKFALSLQKTISIEDWLKYQDWPILDVRSPGEYNHAHISGAISLPLFTDEERAIVGTLYKQEGKGPVSYTHLKLFILNECKINRVFLLIKIVLVIAYMYLIYIIILSI